MLLHPVRCWERASWAVRTPTRRITVSRIRLCMRIGRLQSSPLAPSRPALRVCAWCFYTCDGRSNATESIWTLTPPKKYGLSQQAVAATTTPTTNIFIHNATTRFPSNPWCEDTCAKAAKGVTSTYAYCGGHGSVPLGVCIS